MPDAARPDQPLPIRLGLHESRLALAAAATAATGLALVSACGSTDGESQPAAQRPADQTAAAPASSGGRLLGSPLVMRGAEGRLVVVLRSRTPFAERASDGAVVPGTLRIGDAQSGRYQGYDGYLGALSSEAGSSKCYLWTVTLAPRLKDTPLGQPARYSLRYADGTTDSGETAIQSAPPASQLQSKLDGIGCGTVTGERARTLRGLLDS